MCGGALGQCKPGRRLDTATARPPGCPAFACLVLGRQGESLRLGRPHELRDDVVKPCNCSQIHALSTATGEASGPAANDVLDGRIGVKADEVSHRIAGRVCGRAQHVSQHHRRCPHVDRRAPAEVLTRGLGQPVFQRSWSRAEPAKQAASAAPCATAVGLSLRADQCLTAGRRAAPWHHEGSIKAYQPAGS